MAESHRSARSPRCPPSRLWKLVAPLGLGAVTQVAIDDDGFAPRFKPEAAISREPGSAVAPAKEPAPRAPAARKRRPS